jgi:hypothetical protein
MPKECSELLARDWEINFICKVEVGDVKPSNADCPTVVFLGFAHHAL